MFRSIGLSLAFAWLLSTPVTAARAEPADFVLDPDHLSITFFVQHVGFADTAGMFLDAEGSFRYDEEARELSDLRVVIQTASVFTNHERRDEHLRGADFLNVEAYPEMIFEGRSAEAIDDTTGRIVGDVTLLGVTRPMTLDVRLNKSGNYPFGDGHYAIGIDATGTIRRSEFGMTYAVDGNIVGDEVRFVIGLEAIRQD